MRSPRIGRGVDNQKGEGVADNNVMRHEYRALTDPEKRQMQYFEDLGLQFHDECTRIGSSRELSLAQTKIEEAVMWAVKHVTGKH